MRITSTLLLVSGFSVITTVTAIMMAAGSKIPILHSQEFSGMNAYARPTIIVVDKDYQQKSRAKAWEQYRRQVKACAAEPVNSQDACLQQARRERKQNTGVSRKSHSPKPGPSNTQLAFVE